METKQQDERVLSYGEKAVGLTFDSFDNPRVQKVKELYAQIIDICYLEQMKAGHGGSKWNCFGDAITKTREAQRRVVIALTWDE